MITLKECEKRLCKLSDDIDSLLRAVSSDYYYGDELARLRYDKMDPQDNFMIEKFEKMFEKLYAVKITMRYLQRQVSKTGRLHMNPNGRMMLCDVELTCGSSIEVLVDIDPEEPEKGKRWLHSRIEYEEGEGYYLVEEPSISMEGLEARIR